MTQSNQNPAGWPTNLMPYRPEGHQPRTELGTIFYPYDVTAKTVKSWVAIRAGRYVGMICKDAANKGMLQVNVVGQEKTQFQQTFLAAAVHFAD